MPDVATSDQLRLFIAVSVPEEVKTEIERAQDEIRRVVNSRAIRWTHRGQFHLTLKFLGDVDSSRLEALTSALDHACRGFEPLQLKAEKVGFFPNPRAPRVLWVGISEANEQLGSLQHAVETATLPFCAEARMDKFAAHITLARIQKIHRSEIDALGTLADRLSRKSLGTWTAPEVELLRSELSPTGAIHTVLSTSPLTKSE